MAGRMGRHPVRCRAVLADPILPGAMLLVMVLLATLLAHGSARADQPGAPVARTVVALFDGSENPNVRMMRVHSAATLPLNWLGLTVDYRDVRAGLPPVWNDPDVRGVLTWFDGPIPVDPATYLAWARRVIASGRRFVVLGDVGVANTDSTPAAVIGDLHRFWSDLGIDYRENYAADTYDDRIVAEDGAMVGFERRLDGPLPAFEQFLPGNPADHSFLVIRRPGALPLDSHLVMTTPHGGFVAPGYGAFEDPPTGLLQWYVNPFAFFRLAFATQGLPKPDATTLSGRRIYYAQIDGDGWRNVSTVPEYAGQHVIAAEVVRRKLIAPFPDLPISVAPIAADLDPAWVGTPQSRAAARGLFALPQVEMATHTYTHPFQWSFFKHYTVASEAPFQAKYKAIADGTAFASEEADNTAPRVPGLDPGYSVPRAYGGRPFDLNMEIQGSIDYINRFGPPGKRVQLLQWPGDTTPFLAAVRAVRLAGVANINGGDSRDDPDYPSVSSVAPLGHRWGGEIQVYASNSNEDTYTDLWTDRYFGFRDVVETFRNTEHPRRLTAEDVYYHMYSGERSASVNAILSVLAYVRAHPVCPVATSHFARIVDGFFTTKLVPAGPRAWRVLDRGDLETIRFEAPGGLAVDYGASKGVLGARLYQGQLYVALDRAVAEPLIVLADPAAPPATAPAAQPVLIDARWDVWNLHGDGAGFSVTVQGFGAGTMDWLMPAAGSYRVSAGTWSGTVTAGPDRMLHIAVPGEGAYQPMTIRVERLES